MVLSWLISGETTDASSCAARVEVLGLARLSGGCRRLRELGDVGVGQAELALDAAFSGFCVFGAIAEAQVH